MIIDVVTIFPEYLAPLRLSLLGRAGDAGLVDVRVHDLRDWTHDRHRTVDDTPYGGGAGMVLKPEPWGEALDALLAEPPTPRLLIMTPSGVPFTQATAARLAAQERLVVACGRYEGIDARVAQWAATRMPVEEISIGDYVLNGGEVAAMVVIEAVARLIPGVIGNPGSLAEESHTLAGEALLEYPGFTKPPTWRGLDVPEILLGGNHGAIEAWRAARAADLTRARRPDLFAAVAPGAPRLVDGFTPDSPPDTPTFAFEVLGPEHNASDLAAWTSSVAHIHASPGWRADGWPDREYTPAENLADLARHRARHQADIDYAWTVLDPGAREIVGCVYVKPGRGERPVCTCWVRADRADLDAPLRRHLTDWLAGWPVKVRLARR